jgi:uncharacterized protein YfaQ (DUF2300 family)
MSFLKKTSTVALAAASLFAVSTAVISTAHAAGEQKCVGGNACKGQSACKSASSACKGQNACKGQGFVMTSERSACEAAGGKLEG